MTAYILLIRAHILIVLFSAIIIIAGIVALRTPARRTGHRPAGIRDCHGPDLYGQCYVRLLLLFLARPPDVRAVLWTPMVAAPC